MPEMQADAAQEAQPAWDAKQYSEALAHLERLQEQVSRVRSCTFVYCLLTCYRLMP